MKPYLIEEIRGIIESKNCSLLSKTYKNRKIKIKVKCNICSTVWKTTFNHFIDKHNPCRICGFNTTQNKIYRIVKEWFKDSRLNYRNFDWLKTKKGGYQEIDIWVPSIKLAIEYDGEQHFRPVCFGGRSLEDAKEELKKTKRRDKLKNKKILLHKEDVNYFIRFNYKEKITKEYVLQKLISIGVDL